MKPFWILLTLLVACRQALPLLREDPNQSLFNLIGYLSDSNLDRNQQLTTLLEGVEMEKPQGFTVSLVNCTNSQLGICGAKRASNDLLIWYKSIWIPYRSDFQIKLVLEWCRKIYHTHFTVIQSVDQLKQMVEQHRFVYLYFNRDERKQEEIDAMEKASKYFSHFAFGVVFNPQVRTALGQTGGNFTVYKYPFVLENRNDMDNRQSGWDGLMSFVLTWCYPEINLVSDQIDLTRKRFSSGTELEFVALMCDDSRFCNEEVVPGFYKFYLANREKYRFQVRLHLMSLRESHMIKYYYSIVETKYPAFVYAKLQNKELRVYTEALQQGNNDLTNWYSTYFQRAQDQSFKYDYLSEPVPKNNGLGNGKGIEKQIQQFVYDSLEKTLSENPEKWYVVLYTILGSGCTNCQDFYKEFKKARSFLSGDELGDSIVFGRYEFMKNIILQPKVENIPDVILYKPTKGQEKRQSVRLDKHQDYDRLMEWLNAHLTGQTVPTEEL